MSLLWVEHAWSYNSQGMLYSNHWLTYLSYNYLTILSYTGIIKYTASKELNLYKMKQMVYNNTVTLIYDKHVRGVIDKFVSFFHRINIYGWIYIIFCHYQQQSVINRKKTLKYKVRQTCDVTMTLMTSHVVDVVVNTLEDRYGWCTLSGYKCYSTSAIIVKFSDNICT